jgi:hypothetical protein
MWKVRGLDAAGRGTEACVLHFLSSSLQPKRAAYAAQLVASFLMDQRVADVELLGVGGVLTGTLRHRKARALKLHPITRLLV